MDGGPVKCATWVGWGGACCCWFAKRTAWTMVVISATLSVPVGGVEVEAEVEVGAGFEVGAGVEVDGGRLGIDALGAEVEMEGDPPDITGCAVLTRGVEVEDEMNCPREFRARIH